MLTNMHLNTHDLSLLVVLAALGLSYVRTAGLPEGTQRIWYALIWTGYLVPFYLFTQVFDWPIRLTTLMIAAMLAVLLSSSQSTFCGRG